MAAGPSRLVYEVPEGTRIVYTLEKVLEALTRLRLRVSPNATPAGEASQQERGPEQSTDLETAIEAPYRLIVSPSGKAAFRHASTPQGPPDRVELWRTHLTVRRGDGTFDDDADQRIVRALWTRDRELPAPGFDQPLIPFDRTAIVDQTHGGNPANADTPLQVSALRLSSLGAWFDWKQGWEFPSNIVDYRHQAYMGRDGYVRVATRGSCSRSGTGASW